MRVGESHDWALDLPAGTVKPNHSRASIAVSYSLGACGRRRVPDDPGQAPAGPGVRQLGRELRRRRQTFETFSVNDPTAGTPFSSITHTLAATVKRSSFFVDATLLNAAVRAPGGPLSGRLTASAGEQAEHVHGEVRQAP